MTITRERDGLTKRSSLRAVEKEARIVGIRGGSAPTLQAVDRRRSQLWTLAFSGLVCLAVGVAVLTSGDSSDLGLANSIGFRVGTVVLVVGLAAYVMEKEHHLRRLAEILVNERVAAEAMSERLKELTTLCDAGTAMNSLLLIEEVLKLILSSAFELLHAASGSIMLLEESDSLVVVCAVGDATTHRTSTKVGDGYAGRAALLREPVVIQGAAADGLALPIPSAMCVPLIHRGVLFGVLNLSGSTDRVYTEYDVRSASLFGAHAAIAIANARLSEAMGSAA